MQKKREPFIHLFSTPLGYYLYDVNTNEILKIECHCRNTPAGYSSNFNTAALLGDYSTA